MVSTCTSLASSHQTCEHTDYTEYVGEDPERFPITAGIGVEDEQCSAGERERLPVGQSCADLLDCLAAMVVAVKLDGVAVG
jgi:hypothetical protein